MKISEFLRIREAAEFLGVTQNTLRNWEYANKIQVYRNPRNQWRLYRKVDLQNLLDGIQHSATQLDETATIQKRKYLQDEKGNFTAILLPIQEFNALKEEIDTHKKTIAELQDKITSMRNIMAKF